MEVTSESCSLDCLDKRISCLEHCLFFEQGAEGCLRTFGKVNADVNSQLYPMFLSIYKCFTITPGFDTNAIPGPIPILPLVSDC